MEYARTPGTILAVPLVFTLFLMLPKSSPAEQFSIAVIPDTQFYSQDNPGIFNNQTAWIRANLALENIIYVAHLGDIVDSQFCNGGQLEWGRADTAMSELDDAPAIPYGVLPGNHDFDTVNGNECAATRNNYNNGFPPTVDGFGPGRYGSWYGGSEDGTTNDNNYALFSSPGGMEFIAINLAWSAAGGPAELATLTWADNLLKANPDRIGIVTSHSILSDVRTGGVDCERSDDFTEYGDVIWNELKDNPNLALVLSGHCRGERWITHQRGSAERPGCLGDTHLLMSNYQFYEGQQSGYMRIMRFDTAARTIAVETFSTEPGVPGATAIATPAPMNTSSVSNFSLDYNAFVFQCADVALTMDRSGSMNAPSAAIAGTKLDALKNAADLFIDQIALDGTHRVVLEQFNSAPVAWTVPEVPWTDLTSGNAPTAHGQVASMSGGGSTNIISGLQAAVGELSVADPNDRQVVVLFTDGRHNTPSVLGDAALQAALEGELTPGMELYSVGFGTSINNMPLSGAASNNGGWHVTEVDPIVVAKSFSLIAARVMDNQTLTDPLYVIKPGETRTHPVGVSRSDSNLTIAVHWDLFDSDRVSTNVIPPGGEGCAISSGSGVPGVPQTSGTNYRLVRVNLPYPCDGAEAHGGEWQVQMTVSDAVRAPERVDVLAYAASPIRLDARASLAGARLNIAASLNGALLKDATFTAYILPPLPERGDSTRLDELGSTPEGAASLPTLGLIPRDAVAVPLTVSGRTDESIEAEGTFDPSRKGLYQVRVVADFIDGFGQAASREGLASFYSPKAKWWVVPGYWIAILVIFVVIIAGLRTLSRASQKR